ncbi:MAG: sensor histidine kinase N-terminal domain-containing protein [Burkholderiaceae bacterium]|nr:sensor histidine kinase N-terminal domain-containing protein [Burkholderiaceae bacterium]
MRSSVASIRARLLAWLLPLLVLILVTSSLFDYRRAVVPVQAAFDQALINAAVAVAARVRFGGNAVELDLSDQSISLLRTDIVDQVYFRVVDPNGNTLGGDSDLRGPTNPLGPTLFDADFRGQPLRGVAYPAATPSGNTVVIVGETTNKRERAARDLILSRILPDLGLVLIAMLVVWVAVGAVLRPLEQLAQQVRARSPDALGPLAVSGAPDEVRPLIDALNRLFSLIGATQDGQRRFIENAAHQLRTPLAGLKAQVDLAIGEARAPDAAIGASVAGAPTELPARLERVREATSRVTRLANQLLSLARSTPTSHDASSRKRIDLAELVGAGVASQIDRAIVRDQDLGAETSPAAIDAVEWELRELLANLIDNAIRYTPAGGRITVRCARADEHVYLEVEDTGPGIPADQRERVFDRFYRLAQSQGGGSGLGLSIVGEIAALYGASVQIADSPSGRGTTVRVRFPLAATPAPSAAAEDA